MSLSAKKMLMPSEPDDLKSFKQISIRLKRNFEGHPETFNRKVCVQYHRKEKSSKCTCGRFELEHKDDEMRGSSTQYKEKKNDAYGDIHFQVDGRQTQSKFARISDETEPAKALKLLLRYWKLRKPNILISVTGGAKDFFLTSEQKKAFAEGLRKVVETTHVWVITGGTNVGVMKEVGKALRGLSRINYDHSLKGMKRSKVSLIGIASWGALKDREVFSHSDGTVKMVSSMQRPTDLAYPDNNHSYFLFVDDGRVRRYGGEIAFRADFEKEITKMSLVKSEDAPERVPAVQLVVGGGPNTIRTVAKSISNGIPVVIFQNTGRGADLICDFFLGKYDDSSDRSPSIYGASQLFLDVGDLLAPGERSNKNETIEELVLMLYEICSHKDFVSIYNIDESETLDAAILKAWIKCGKEELKSQLKLAIIWNRVDIAHDCIKSWKKENNSIVINEMHELMMDVLQYGRVNFFDLLTSNGVDINTFLTKEVLVKLYNMRKDKGRRLIENALRFDKNYTLDMSDVNRIIRLAAGEFLQDRYDKDDDSTTKRGGQFKDPFNELFLWAIINLMTDTAKYFWNKGDESLAKSLIGCVVLRRLAKLASLQGLEDLQKSIESSLRDFETMAVNLITICQTKDDFGAEKLLKYELKSWGNETCLHLAVLARNEEFVASSACQNTLSKIWYGDMEPHRSPSARALIGLLFPFAIPWFKYRDSDYVDPLFDKRMMATRFVEDDSEEVSAKRPKRCMASRQDLAVFVSKFYKFYTAPITKFWANALFYMAFLVIFCSVVLIKLPKEPSVLEWILFMYVCTLAMEEGRQIIQAHGVSAKRKILDYLSRIWNLCDAFGIFLFFLGFGLRFSESTRSQGHILLSIDVCIWILRLLDIFSVNKYFGPYIFMIGKMCKEMLYFLFIMVVFLFAYGILRLAVLEPRDSWSMFFLPDVVFKPYFQIYGELFLEDSTSKTTVFGTKKNNDYGELIIACALAIYLLVANILLLNLLIAIFNNIYNRTEARSLQLWGSNRYHVIEEFHKKPALVPPFVVFSHIVSIFKTLFPRCRGRRRPDGKFKARLRTVDEFRALMAFEESCATGNTIDVTKKMLDSDRTDLVTRLQHSVNMIIHAGSMWGGGKKRGTSVRHQRFSSFIAGPNASLSEVDLRAALRKASSRSHSHLQSPDEEDTKLPIAVEMELKPVKEVEGGCDNVVDEGCIQVHQMSRQSPYPGTSIRRTTVPDVLVDWRVDMPYYLPAVFSVRGGSLDSAKVDCDNLSSQDMGFNKLTENVDRRSAMGFYQIIGGFPRNPQGRTGLRGRGKFSRWGPNHYAETILTRWKKEETKHVTAGSVLQYLLIQRGALYVIPSGTVSKDEEMPSFLLTSLLAMLNTEEDPERYQVDDLKPLLESGKKLFSGYLDSPLNTDNSWLETTVTNFHDEQDKYIGSIPDVVTVGGTTYTWKDSDSFINASPKHLDYLRSIADLRNASFYYLI